jgi:hypothetical protein
LGKLQHQLNGIRAAAKALGASTVREVTQVKKRVLSAAAKAKISKATKARWAKFRAEQNKKAKAVKSYMKDDGTGVLQCRREVDKAKRAKCRFQFRYGTQILQHSLTRQSQSQLRPAVADAKDATACESRLRTGTLKAQDNLLSRSFPQP